MIQVVTKNSISDMLKRPQEYVSSDMDEVLLKSIKPHQSAVMLMLGYDDKRQSYYFVIEDDEVSEDVYCEKEALERKFDEILYDLGRI